MMKDAAYFSWLKTAYVLWFLLTILNFIDNISTYELLSNYKMDVEEGNFIYVHLFSLFGLIPCLVVEWFVLTMGSLFLATKFPPVQWLVSLILLLLNIGMLYVVYNNVHILLDLKGLI